MQVLKVTTLITFSEWLKVREDFHQGVGALGASLLLKSKRKGRQKGNLTPNPMLNIDRGQSYQGASKDDGNG